MLRAVIPPLVTGYAVFVAMVLLGRRRPVPRPRGLLRPEPSPGSGRLVGTILGGYAVFLVIVLVFHVWLARERDGFAEAVWGGAFLSALAVMVAFASSFLTRRIR
jgi:hypothetical protein